MRDPNRLDKFYEELKNLHKTYVSDWRFRSINNEYFRNLSKRSFFLWRRWNVRNIWKIF